MIADNTPKQFAGSWSGLVTVLVPALLILLLLTGCGELGTVVAFGSVALAWDPVTTNENSTTIQDLSGYRLHYGRYATTYTRVIDVGNQTSYIVQNLPIGNWYFAVTCYDDNGYESRYSQVLTVLAVAN